MVLENSMPLSLHRYQRVKTSWIIEATIRRGCLRTLASFVIPVFMEKYAERWKTFPPLLPLSLSPPNGGKKRLRRSIIRLFSRVRARLSVTSTVVVAFSTDPSSLLDEFRAVEIFLRARFSRLPRLFPLSFSFFRRFDPLLRGSAFGQRSVSVEGAGETTGADEEEGSRRRRRKGRKSPRAMEARGGGRRERGKGESEEERERGGWTIRRNQGFVKRRSRAPEWVVMRGERITLKTSEGRDGTREEVVREGGLRERARERERVEEETGQVSARFLGWFARVRGARGGWKGAHIPRLAEG